jgi:hypothetical protein
MLVSQIQAQMLTLTVLSGVSNFLIIFLTFDNAKLFTYLHYITKYEKFRRRKI